VLVCQTRGKAVKPPELTDEEALKIVYSVPMMRDLNDGDYCVKDLAGLIRAAFALAWERRGKVDAAELRQAAPEEGYARTCLLLMADVIERGEEEG